MLPSFESGLPKDLDGNNIVGNNFSLLLKYHFETKLPLKLEFASGWTYTIKTSEYYYYENLNAPQSLRREVSIADDYEIPLLFEMRYPIWKTRCSGKSEIQFKYRKPGYLFERCRDFIKTLSAKDCTAYNNVLINCGWTLSNHL